MKTIRLDVETLEIRSFPTTAGTVQSHEWHAGDNGQRYVTAGSGCSETNGVYVCKSCGPCCI